MKAYRLAMKALKQQHPDIKTPVANLLQNAFRNKLACNAIIKAKQDRTNEVISQLNQQKQHTNIEQMK